MTENETNIEKLIEQNIVELGKPFAIKLFIKKGKLAMMNEDYKNAKIMFESIYEFDPNNEEVKKLLKKCEAKYSKK